MTFPTAPASCLHISWFVPCGDWHFSCTSAVYHQCYKQSPVCLFQAGRNTIHSGCQCPSSFRERVCLVSLTLLVEPAVVFWCLWHGPCTSLCSGLLCHIRDTWTHSGTIFDGVCVKRSTLSTTITTVSTVTLLWRTTVSLILRRPPITSCAVVGCIMPRFACCLWPMITHCMNVRFG